MTTTRASSKNPPAPSEPQPTNNSNNNNDDNNNQETLDEAIENKNNNNIDNDNSNEARENQGETKIIKQHEDQQEDLLKTPEKLDMIPRDDSFKTCKTYMPSAKTRRVLRMTPARNSILEGGTPFKETTPGSKKFNSRTKKLASKSGSRLANETADSNETFIRHEQELLFDRDSLEMAHHKLSSTPLILPEIIHQLPSPPQLPAPKLAPQQLAPSAQLQARPQPASQKRQSKTKPRSPIRTKRPQAVANSKPVLLPPPAAPASQRRCFRKPFSPNRFKKPQPSVPSSAKSTASSRYLSQWNSSRLTRAQSFKSTAELEREYFNSLRSRF